MSSLTHKMSFQRYLGPLALLALSVLGLLYYSRPEILVYKVALNPTGQTPLAAICLVETRNETQVEEIVVEGGLKIATVPHEFAKQHRVPLAGLHPEHLHKISLKLRDRAGRVFRTPAQVVVTDPLPIGFPKFEDLENSADIGRGYILGTFFSSKNSRGFHILLDQFGQVVWFQPTESESQSCFPVSNGRILVLEQSTGIGYIQDYTGGVVAEFQAPGYRLGNSATLGDDKIWILATRDQAQYALQFDLLGQLSAEINLTQILGASPPDRPDLMTVAHMSSHKNGQQLLLSVPGQNSVVEIYTPKPQLLWIFGPQKAWIEASLPWLLRAPSTTLPPLGVQAALWAENGALVCLCLKEGRLLVKDYQIDLSKRLATEYSSSSFPESPGLESAHIVETSWNPHLLIGYETDTGFELFGQSRGSDPKVLYHLRCLGWSLKALGSISQL